MLHLSATLNYYKRPEIQEAIAEHSAGKEVAVRFNDRFGKRPEIIQYPNDVLDFAKKGATSFHCSEELWSNPLNLQPGMTKKQLDELRTGWDLLLDVDCYNLEYSKIAADLIVKELQRHNIKSLTAKFSGNKGFHIAVPFEAFPNEINETRTRTLFPEAAKRIALYIKQNITKKLGQEILQLSNDSFVDIAKKTGAAIQELKLQGTGSGVRIIGGRVVQNVQMLNVEPFLKIDTLLLSSRHMYRMPYSLHEKSGLASIPVNVSRIREFSVDEASPETSEVKKHKFMDRTIAKPSEAAELFTKAFDATFAPHGDEKETKEYEIPAEAIPEQFFPPCIQKLLKGVEDGRKRTLFMLINFLGSCGWSYEAMEARLREWNKSNKEPLHDTYFLGQIRYARQQKKRMLPPNCGNQAYYQDLRVKCPDEYCRFRNPVNYARKKSRI